MQPSPERSAKLKQRPESADQHRPDPDVADVRFPNQLNGIHRRPLGNAEHHAIERHEHPGRHRSAEKDDPRCIRADDEADGDQGRREIDPAVEDGAADARGAFQRLGPQPHTAFCKFDGGADPGCEQQGLKASHSATRLQRGVLVHGYVHHGTDL